MTQSVLEGRRLDVEAAWRTYGDEFTRVARRILGNGCDAEDAVQDLMVDLVRKGALIDGDPRVYLLQALRHKCLDVMTAQKAVPVDPDTLRQRASHDDPEQQLLRRELRAVLATLTRRERIVVVNRLMLGRSLGEVAELAGLRSPKIIIDLVNELRQQLGDQFAEFAHPPEPDLARRRRELVQASTARPSEICRAYGISNTTYNKWLGDHT